MRLNLKKNIAFTGLFLVFCFLVLSLFVHFDTFRWLDYDLTVFFQSNISRRFDVLFSYTTYLGSSEFVTLSVIAIFFILIYKKRYFFWGIFLYFSIFLVELAGKMHIFHPDPPKIFNRVATDFRLPTSQIVSTGFSYPSGHMSRIAFLTTILTFFLVKKRKPVTRITGIVLLYLLFLTVFFISRIYLGEHWFTDCLGGVFLGVGIAFISIHLYSKGQK